MTQNQMKLKKPSTPWGKNTIWDWFPLGVKPEEGTVRGGLVRAIDAQHNGDLRAEEAAWLSLSGDEELFWKEAARWVLQRWAYVTAESSGYVHSRKDISDHVGGVLSPAHGGLKAHVTEQASGSSTEVLYYEFNDGKWAAFEQSPVMREELDGLSLSVQPDRYAQLDEKPNVNLQIQEEKDEVPFEIDLDSEPEPEPEEEPSVLGEAFSDFPWEIEFKGPDPEPKKPKKRNKKTGLPNPFEFELPEEEEEAEDITEPSAVVVNAKPVDKRVEIKCSNSKCTSNIVTSAENWPPVTHECKTCNEGTLVARPCGVRDHKHSAWLLPQRPRLPAKWLCEGCGHDDIFHGGDVPSSLPCSECECESFKTKKFSHGSECNDCGFKVMWNCTLPGVVNACDKCGKEGTLVLFGKPKTPDRDIAPTKKRGRGRPRKKPLTFADAETKKAVKKQRTPCVECEKPIKGGQEYREVNKKKVHIACLWG